MQPTNRPKKRVHRESVDGILPSQNSRIDLPQYYRGASQPALSKRPAAQASRRRPHAIATDFSSPATSPEDTPQIGAFTAKNSITDPHPISSQFDEPNLDKKADKKAKKREKKAKKERGRIRQWWKNRSLKFKAALISLVIILGAGGLLGVRLYSLLHSVFAKSVGNGTSAALGDQVRPDQLNTEGDGRLNILILGRGGDENEAPDLTDTMIIASIDLENQQASLLSVPRDTYVGSASDNSKINGTFSRGKEKALAQGKSKEDAENEGIKSATTAMRNVAGVPIHRYVLVDYKAFRDVVNALGGISVNVPTKIDDYFANWHFAAGAQTMNGDRALQYARTRHGNVRGDFDRGEHQRQLLVAMRDKASSTGIIANPVKLNSLANAVQKNIRTDLSVDEAKTLYNKTKALADANIVSLDLAKPDGPLVTTGMIGSQSVVHPLAGITDFSKIREYARTNMIDPYLKKEAPTVAVYNASGKAGLATQVGDVLAGYGYKVLVKETAQTTQTSTLVVKQTKDNKPFTDRFLGQRFLVSITSSLPSGVVPAAAAPAATTTGSTAPAAEQPQYIIILGSEFATPSGPTW